MKMHYMHSVGNKILFVYAIRILIYFSLSSLLWNVRSIVSITTCSGTSERASEIEEERVEGTRERSALIFMSR